MGIPTMMPGLLPFKGLALGLLVGFSITCSATVGAKDKETIYKPKIVAADFVPDISNKYFRFEPGDKFVFVQKGLTGTERIEVEVLKETRQVMGVTVRVVRDRVWVDGVLKEDTRDWFAQDKAGNVWYFGEDVDNYKNGKLADHKGAWQAGVDGAQPGIIMPANPVVGQTYRQEYYRGHAEDMATVLSLNEKVTVPRGTYTGCLMTKDFTPLDPTATERKYYCPQVGFVTLEEANWIVFKSRTELVSVTKDR